MKAQKLSINAARQQSKKIAIKVLTSLAIALSAISCSTALSENIDIDEFYVRYYLTQENGDVTAEAILQVGGPTGSYIELSNGDSLEVITENGSYLMTGERTIINQYSYKTNFTPHGAFPYEFILIKDGEEYSDLAYIPEPVAMSHCIVNGLNTGNQVKKQTPFSAVWATDPSGANVSITFSYSDEGINKTYTCLSTSGQCDFTAASTTTDSLVTPMDATLQGTRSDLDSDISWEFKGGYIDTENRDGGTYIIQMNNI